MSVGRLRRTAGEVAVRHGYFVGYGYLLFRLLARVTGWYLGAMLTRRIGAFWPRFGAWAYDQRARKTTPRSQDLRVLVGVAVTIASVVFAQSQDATLKVVGTALVAWHLFGIAVYHLNLLLFDEFYPEQDPRVWSYRRVFIQAVINVAEAVVIFAVLYCLAQRDLTFQRSLFWSIQSLTLNVPSDWQPGGITPADATVRIWVGQVGTSLFFVVVVLALIGAAMFKRPEIAAEDKLARPAKPDDGEGLEHRDQHQMRNQASMTSDFQAEHAIETYKSLVQISVAGLKLLALLNGGAAVALLAYLGNIAGKGVAAPDVRFSMGSYLVGLVFCGVAFAASYLTQLRLYNESVGASGSGVGRHQLWLWLAMTLALLSLAAFAIGSYSAALRLQ